MSLRTARTYRGKLSSGCDSCRKAKKRCGLEQPSCARCVKLKKICSGSRDPAELQVQDESESVRQRAEKHKTRSAPQQHVSITPQVVSSPEKIPTVDFSEDDAPATVTNGSDWGSGSESIFIDSINA